MNDDFNTSDAIAVLFDLANEVNKTGSREGYRIDESAGWRVGVAAAGPAAFFPEFGVTADGSQFTSGTHRANDSAAPHCPYEQKL